MSRVSMHVAVAAMLSVSVSATGPEPMEVQRAHQLMFREAAARVEPCVVQIQTLGGAQPRVARDTPVPDVPLEVEDDGTPPEPSPFVDTLGSEFLVADGPTTGIIYRADGLILTSSFNFVRDPSHITVRLADDRRFVAELVARDAVRKLALLRIDATDLPTPTWSGSDEIRIGQWAVALGRGFGGDRPSITVGVVSALDRMQGNAVQTDAKLSPANYGGPLVDLQGRVLGICAPMAQRPGELAGVEFYDAGIGFAVPRERVAPIVDEMEEGVSFYRGWLGVRIDVRDTQGCRIAQVADPSPVHAVGIRAGDYLRRANGHDIRHIGDLRQAIYMIPAGDTVRLVVERNGLQYGYELALARSSELGPLIEQQEPIDPADPFPIPDDRFPWP